MTTKELLKAEIHLTKHDVRLGEIIAKTGHCRLNRSTDYFHALLSTIISQQLSSRAADTIIERLMLVLHHNPSPEAIFSAPEEDLRMAGLSRAKIKSIKDLSQKILNNELKLKGIEQHSVEQVSHVLQKVKGIGPWSVDMFLIFSLGLPDVLPLGDLGIRKGMMIVHKLKKLPEPKKMELIAKKYNWHPYCSVASWYLWRAVDNKYG